MKPSCTDLCCLVKCKHTLAWYDMCQHTCFGLALEVLLCPLSQSMVVHKIRHLRMSLRAFTNIFHQPLPLFFAISFLAMTTQLIYSSDPISPCHLLHLFCYILSPLLLMLPFSLPSPRLFPPSLHFINPLSAVTALPLPLPLPLPPCVIRWVSAVSLSVCVQSVAWRLSASCCSAPLWSTLPR